MYERHTHDARWHRPRQTLLAVLALAGTLLFGCGTRESTPTATPNLDRIKHVVVIMQENRSFDNYFGTFPGADGIPITGGVPAVCNTNPTTGECVRPYHAASDVDEGGPHIASAAAGDINGGKMDGFINQVVTVKQECKTPYDPLCGGLGDPNAVMAYHDERELPNYWAYAREYVLQDRMFESVASWSLPSHLYMVSAWSADCPSRDPASCKNDPVAESAPGYYAWTDITYLLHRASISWRYYVAPGTHSQCEEPGVNCPKKWELEGTPGIWNPLPRFEDVLDNQEVQNVLPVTDFYAAAKTGDLPQVSWIIPSGKLSEHPGASIRAGQNYVTALVNAIMSGPAWDSTVIFISWDDWGGFYDHVPPPVVDTNGYGIRVPGLMISAYARRGYIDHQLLSFDAYLKFIEDVFLRGDRLDPEHDGRPDPRLTVREAVPELGDLALEFDFSQSPRAPLILQPLPELPTASPTSSPSVTPSLTPASPTATP